MVLGQAKQGIKKILTGIQQEKYNRLLEKKTVSYDAWIRQTERKREKEQAGSSALSVKEIPYEACSSFCLGKVVQKETADIILFADSCGQTSSFAKEAVAEYFDTHSGVMMLYGDEDVLSPEGIRYTPWFKPDWSPDTFRSFFYFGSIFAVRTELLLELTMEEKMWILQNGGGDGRKDVYCICYILAQKCGGFEKRLGNAAGDGKWKFPVGHLDEVLFHGKNNQEMMVGQEETPDFSGCPGAGKYFQGQTEDGKLSVIIPSKDHAEVVKRCLLSLQAEAKRGFGRKYEIILVDNGSRAETKQELENWLEKSGMAYRYLYRKMPFHFSKMCNLGAEAAEGDVLLFLNDDVEIPDFTDRGENNFLEELYHMACMPYMGAAGAKLYYPDSAKIQHAGIVNLRLGPVHKLQFKEDNISYYYGWNRKRRNVIAVTGACMAVEKKKFWEAGGFPEELPVAFNDVDFCFSLFEKGYYNAVIQDFALYHHESLSRGNDEEREKLERLLAERDKLYERHPLLYGKDPFYHKYLANDMLSTGFELQADYELPEEMVPVRKMDEGELTGGAMAKAGAKAMAKAREDACVMISLEYAGTAAAFKGEEKGKGGELLIQGYCFITGSDNACYEKWILLRPEKNAEENGGRMMCLFPEPLRRKDVEENLPDQVHVGLAGFAAVIDGKALAKGSYRIGVLAKDRCSGSRLYAWTNRYLQNG